MICTMRCITFIKRGLVPLRRVLKLNFPRLWSHHGFVFRHCHLLTRSERYHKKNCRKTLESFSICSCNRVIHVSLIGENCPNLPCLRRNTGAFWEPCRSLNMKTLPGLDDQKHSLTMRITDWSNRNTIDTESNSFLFVTRTFLFDPKSLSCENDWIGHRLKLVLLTSTNLSRIPFSARYRTSKPSWSTFFS